MDSELWIQISILIVLLIASGLFSASETALMAISKADARHMVEQNLKGSKRVAKLVENPTKLLSAILVGNNLVNIGASSLATVVAMNIFGNSGAGIATGVITLLVLIFGEITPKSLATNDPQKIAAFVSKPISLVVFVLGPIAKLLMFVTSGLTRLLGVKIDTDKPFITEAELKTIVNVSHEEGVLEDDTREMLNNVFDFGESYTKDIMIPRTDMVAVNVDSTYEEILEIYKSDQFSRMPVYNETYDNIIGILYMKDLFLQSIDPSHFSLNYFIREAYFVHEFKLIDELFKEMRSKKVGMVIVLDEYGGTSGLVTMEDIVEEIVGDIDDEYDNAEEKFTQVNEKEYLLDGASRISEVNQLLDLDICSNEFDSIGGFVIGLLDRFPDEGEEVNFEDIKLTVTHTEGNRIQKVKITLPET